MTPIYAQRIREIRQKNKMTQSEFAKTIGTTKNQLSKYELNLQEVPTKIIIAICEKYNITADWLLGIRESQTRKLTIHSTAYAAISNPTDNDRKVRDGIFSNIDTTED